MTQWKTIDSAPKNESILLNIGGKIVVGHYKLVWGGWQAEYCHDDFGMLPTPHHWMPLPSTPPTSE